MRKAGYIADGLELSREKCESAKKKFNIDLYHMFFPPSEGFPKELLHSYDVVCIFHVLEHVPDPISFLSQTKQLLRENGLVLAEVPNYNDHMKDICLPYNNFSYLRAHLSYFTPDSLANVFQHAGFSDIKLFGDQKYGILNALRWLKEGKPNLLEYEFGSPKGLEWLDDYYKSELEQTLKSYTISALGRV
jgi:SAM-dependent methyltransferase